MSLAEQMQHALQTQPQHDPDRVKRATDAFIENVWPVFALYFPDFNAKYRDVDNSVRLAVAREYARQLLKHGIGAKRLSAGIERTKDKSVALRFHPTPQAFAELCKVQPEDIGLPTFDDVKREITDLRGRYRGESRGFSHQLVAHVDRDAGFQMQTLDDKSWVKVLKHSYEHWCQVATTHGLPEPMMAIEHTRTTRDIEVQNAFQSRGAEIQKKQTNDPLIKRIKNLGKNL